MSEGGTAPFFFSWGRTGNVLLYDRYSYFATYKSRNSSNHLSKQCPKCE